MLFLGSNIGNFDPPGADAFLRNVRAALRAGDALLLGTDLVKPERELLLAYDDPLGVTAAFNRNLLVRINRELGGDFDVGAFRHRAVWNARGVARRDAPGRRPRAARPHRRRHRSTSTFEAGETIWTESSYKYRPDDVVQMLERAGFRRSSSGSTTGRFRADAGRGACVIPGRSKGRVQRGSSSVRSFIR